MESDYVKHLLQKDQQIARDMNVESTPALVLFEHRLGERGVLLEGSFKAQNILSHLDFLIELDYLNDLNNPQIAVVLLSQKTKTESTIYQLARGTADEMLGVLNYIKNKEI